MKKFGAGIHVLIKKGNKYLIMKRSPYDKESPNCWDLPGGGIDHGEQPIKGALREVREEAGIRCRIKKILAVYAIPVEGMWSVEMLAEGEHVSGKVRLSKEHSEFRWVTKRGLSTIKPQCINLLALFKYGISK